MGLSPTTSACTEQVLLCTLIRCCCRYVLANSHADSVSEASNGPDDTELIDEDEMTVRDSLPEVLRCAKN